MFQSFVTAFSLWTTGVSCHARKKAWPYLGHGGGSKGPQHPPIQVQHVYPSGSGSGSDWKVLFPRENFVCLWLVKVAYACFVLKFCLSCFLVCLKVLLHCLSCWKGSSVSRESCVSLLCWKLFPVFSGVSVSFVASMDLRQKWIGYFGCCQLPIIAVAMAAFMAGAQNSPLSSLVTGLWLAGIQRLFGRRQHWNCFILLYFIQKLALDLD